jgi:hypothetical protein
MRRCLFECVTRLAVQGRVNPYNDLRVNRLNLLCCRNVKSRQGGRSIVSLFLVLACLSPDDTSPSFSGFAMSYYSGYREPYRDQHHENASSIPPLEVCVPTSPHPRVFSSSTHRVFVPHVAETNNGHE